MEAAVARRCPRGPARWRWPCRRGRWRRGKQLLQLGELPVFGAEVVAPVADAVGLVDGEGTDLQSLDELQEARRQQALRRDEDQAIAAGCDLRLGLAEGIERHTAIEGCRRIARFTQAIDLILHQ